MPDELKDLAKAKQMELIGKELHRDMHFVNMYTHEYTHTHIHTHTRTHTHREVVHEMNDIVY